MTTIENDAPTRHANLLDWVSQAAELTTPDRVVWIDGSAEQHQALIDELVAAGTFVKLDKKPNSYWCASDPTDVARVEDRTFICSLDEADCGPTNNWMDPAEMRSIMRDLYRGCMKGRTMYVIPFVMGHLDAEKPMFGVEITDSPYVVVSMNVMAKTGTRCSRRWVTAPSTYRPCIRSALRSSPASRTWPGPATTPSTSCSSRRAARSSRTARVTAATRCWARSATRCGSPR